MKLAVDQLGQRLAAELGGDWVSMDASMRASHAIDGLQPTLICLPETPDQIAAALRLCSEADAAVAPYGGGTAISIGNRPRRIDVALDLKRLNRIIEHDDANLTVTVAAGIRLETLQAALGRQKQFLPFDPPYPDRATIGGTIAVNLNGPRRSYYGSVRDRVVGLKVVLASGEQIKAGGKVVKNVAGYDMCKLFVGSLGTLGIIPEATLRTAPAPETAMTLIASGAATQIFNLAHDVTHSQLLPAAVVVLNPSGCQEINSGDLDWKLAVGTEGFTETVARHVGDAKAMAGRLGIRTDLLHNSSHSQLWAGCRDFPLLPDRLVFRMTVPLACLEQTMRTIESWQTEEFCPALAADALAGVLWIVAQPSIAAAGHFQKLVELARVQRGHAVLLAAPFKWKQSVDVWGLAPPALALMNEIKRRFDPRGTLNPGRHVNRI